MKFHSLKNGIIHHKPRCGTINRLFVILLGLLCSSVAIADSTWVPSGLIPFGTVWTVEGSPYCIDSGDVFVAGMEIQAGVTVLFFGEYQLDVKGVLTAIGTETDSIVFTRIDDQTYWNGIIFIAAQEGSELAFCRIEGSRNRGIYIEDSYPTIRNCTIESNTGGGIYSNVTLTLMDCIVSNNAIYRDANVYGAGIRADNGAIIAGCRMTDNQLTAYRPKNNSHSYGGGIYINGTAVIANCLISNNLTHAYAAGFPSPYTHRYAYSRGGGIYVSGTGIMANCIISNCSSTAKSPTGHGHPMPGGSGVYVGSGEVQIVNCTFVGNSYQGLRRESGLATVVNSIFWDNNSSQISGSVTTTYSCIQGGNTGEGNIDRNPLFLSDDSLIIVLGSPCIDAGNPDSSYNDSCFPPSLGTDRNDMGAHGGPYVCGQIPEPPVPTDVIEIDSPELPVDFVLWQNYPNPFNPETRIEFSLPLVSHVVLNIYNILGRHVKTLVNEQLSAGLKRVVWDGKDESGNKVSSGIYFYKISAGNFINTKKMILLK